MPCSGSSSPAEASGLWEALVSREVMISQEAMQAGAGLGLAVPEPVLGVQTQGARKASPQEQPSRPR